MESNKNNWLSYIVISAISLITVIISSFSISPLYDICFGDYGGNLTNGALVMGKYWSKGVIPYKDLFGTEGPIYYLIQRIGWTIDKTNGVMILEIINLALVGVCLYKIISLYCSNKKALIYTLLGYIPFIAFSSGGDNACEFALLPIVLSIYLIIKSKDKSILTSIIIGILLALASFTWIYASILSLGLFIGILINDKNMKQLLCTILGVIIISIIVFGYFYLNNALSDLISGFITIPMRQLGYGDSIIKKSIKAVFALVLVACTLLNKKCDYKLFYIIIGISLFIALLLGDNSWYFYTITVFTIPLSLALLDEQIKFGSIVIMMVVLGICFTPVKNTVSYVKNFDLDYATDMIDSIDENMETLEIDSMLVINEPTYFYLKLDIKPEYKYYYNQRTLFELNEKIYNDTIDFIKNDYEDGLVTYSSNGAIPGDIGDKYVFVTNYMTNHRMIGIYLYDADATYEDE